MQANEPRSLSFGVSAWDPCHLFLAKSLLHPLCAAASLALCLQLWQRHFDQRYFIVAVFAFLATSDFLNDPLSRSERSLSLQQFIRITLRWLALVGFLWALLYLSALSTQFAPEVFITWAAITPPILGIAQLITGRMLRTFSSSYRQRRNAIIVGVTDAGLRLEKELRADLLLGIHCLAQGDRV